MLFALASVQRAASSNNNNKKIIIIIRAITFSPDFSLAKKKKIKGRVFPKYFSPQSSVCESHTFRSCSCSVKGGFKARDAPLTNPHSEESPANLNGGVHTNQGLALKDGPTGCPGVLSESVSAGLALHSSQGQEKKPTSWPCGCISAQEEMGKAGFGWDGHSAGTMGCLERLG